jgi:hypothetical protein
MPKKLQHGGRRKGSGRPRLTGGRAVHKTAVLPVEVAARITRLGGGNFSAGVRALDEFYGEKNP